MKRVVIIGAIVITLNVLGLLIISFFHPVVLQIIWLCVTLSIFFSFGGVSKTREQSSPQAVLASVFGAIVLTIVIWFISRSTIIPVIICFSIMNILLANLYIGLLINSGEPSNDIHYTSSALPLEESVV